MRVLLVGAGGREAALAYRIARSPTLERLTVTGSNPGWPDTVDLVPCTEVGEIVEVARSTRAELVVVGPEAPLAAGLVDALEEAGIPAFGPARGAALLESSKAFAKEIMQASGVPTADCVVVDPTDPQSLARGRERCTRGDVVVKVDGLAAGKGVFVCATAAEALAALDEVERFGDAADRLVLEDRLVGPEVSLFALSDGERIVVLPSAQDHKQLLDGGHGPMTGGMGAYVPCPLIDEAQAQALAQEVHAPVVREMARRGTPYRGVLYAGLMLTPDGPRVLEFNVRFGDPECQPLMALWDDDILPWLYGSATGRLPQGSPRFAAGAACCVVLASAGYPRTSQRGVPIPEPAARDHVVVFHAGTRRGDDGVLRTNGGRVLGLTGVGADLGEARRRAYSALGDWTFEGSQHRTDIAAQGVS